MKRIVIQGNVLRVYQGTSDTIGRAYPLNALSIYPNGNLTGLFITNVSPYKQHPDSFIEELLFSSTSLDGITAFVSISALSTFLFSAIENSISVGGKMGEPVEVTLQRPADTNAYAVNDVISSSTSAPAAIVFDLANAGVPAGGSGYLVKLRALTNNKNWTARLRIHLYKSAITPGNDNSAFGLLWANRANRIGFIDVPSFSTADSTASDSANSLIPDLRFAFKLAQGETRLWAIIQILDAGTPTSGQNFFFSVLVDRN